MAFKMKSGMKPSFKSMGSSPVKQYADKNVSVDKVSDDGRTFTGTDSKGKTGKYKTSGYDAEVMQSDSVGVTGDAVSNMQMEFDMVKGTKYEKGFIDYHGKGDKPGTGKSPAKQRGRLRDRNIDPKFTVKPPSGSRDMDPKFTIRGKDNTNDPLDPRKRGKKPGDEVVKLPTAVVTPRENTDMIPILGGANAARKKAKSPAKSRADRKAGRAAKAAQKHAQAEDRGKSRKADRQAVKVAKHGGHAEAAGTSSGTPMFQTSHGPIREFNPPRNPNEGPYIVRSKPTGQTREPNNDGPNYRHIRERTGLDDGPHPERIKPVGPSPHQAEILGGRPKQLRNYDSFVKEAGSPAKKRGLWDNIHAKRKRGEKMRKKGDKGAPTEKAIRDSQ